MQHAAPHWQRSLLKQTKHVTGRRSNFLVKWQMEWKIAWAFSTAWSTMTATMTHNHMEKHTQPTPIATHQPTDQKVTPKENKTRRREKIIATTTSIPLAITLALTTTKEAPINLSLLTPQQQGMQRIDYKGWLPTLKKIGHCNPPPDLPEAKYNWNRKFKGWWPEWVCEKVNITYKEGHFFKEGKQIRQQTTLCGSGVD